METTRVVVIALLVGAMAAAINSHPQSSALRQALQQRTSTRIAQTNPVRTSTTTTTTAKPTLVKPVANDKDDDDEANDDINPETGFPARLDFLTKYVPAKDGCTGSLDKLEDEDLDAVIDDKQLVDGYKQCLLADRDAVKTTCACVAWELRRIMSGLLTPNLCRKGYVLPYCPTDHQRKKGESFMKYISRVDSQSWKDLVKKYGGKGSRGEQPSPKPK